MFLDFLFCSLVALTLLFRRFNRTFFLALIKVGVKRLRNTFAHIHTHYKVSLISLLHINERSFSLLMLFFKICKLFTPQQSLSLQPGFSGSRREACVIWSFERDVTEDVNEIILIPLTLSTHKSLLLSLFPFHSPPCHSVSFYASSQPFHVLKFHLST